MSIHEITDLDKISITESQNILTVLEPKNPRMSLVYTKRKPDKNLIDIITNRLLSIKTGQNNNKIMLEPISKLTTILEKDNLDESSKQDLRRLSYFCSSKPIKSLFDLGFNAQKNQAKAQQTIKEYLTLLRGYAQDYREIRIGSIIIKGEKS